MCSNSLGRSETLVKIAKRLRLYKPHHSFDVSVGSEVALPGGKWEEGDKNDAETALREAKEEIGLDPSIWRLSLFLNRSTLRHAVQFCLCLVSNYRIDLNECLVTRNITVFPVIGIIWNKNEFIAVPNASEVECIRCSLRDVSQVLFDMYRMKIEEKRKREWMGYNYLLHFFDYRVEGKSYVIWALTAAILIKAASVIYQQPPAFEEHRPKFWSRSRQ
ncbi:Nudix hydrolase 15, mitochondrial [Sesamum angolense]|uniref:Nudix hydrolase 15, mitochondrial n=1 Tax=Sesamum angolense TaxID=2727404 RepID=A0AAE1WU32_9LAMI|nr:Nudix hydrolase 15, mitochondrial [Sesamum angolense]